MKRLTAALKDSAWRGYRLKRIAYKVGSMFKGCHCCGDYDQEDGGRKRYTTGYLVYRSYVPKQVGWTYWCYECGAKDQQAWEDAKDIGMEAIRGSAEAVKAAKKYRLGQREAEVRALDPLQRIAEIEERIRKLLAEERVKEDAR